MGNFIDKNSQVENIKNNSDIVSAIEEVAKIKGVELDLKSDMTMFDVSKALKVDLMDLLIIANKKNGTEKEFLNAYPDQNKSGKSDKNGKPQWLYENEVLELDVRPSLSQGVDPFGLIMQTISKLDGKILKIINSFETTPLYSVLGKQGFEHFSENIGGVWHIYFYKK